MVSRLYCSILWALVDESGLDTVICLASFFLINSSHQPQWSACYQVDGQNAYFLGVKMSHYSLWWILIQNKYLIVLLFLRHFMLSSHLISPMDSDFPLFPFDFLHIARMLSVLFSLPWLSSSQSSFLTGYWISVLCYVFSSIYWNLILIWCSCTTSRTNTSFSVFVLHPHSSIRVSSIYLISLCTKGYMFLLLCHIFL